MPASLLFASSPTMRGVTRNESTRSDSSAASNTSQSSATANKKVSFNRAVRVKKYASPKKSNSSAFDDEEATAANGDLNGYDDDHPGGSPGKKFWFKVYKNKHRHSPDPNELRPDVIYYGKDGEVIDGYNGRNDNDVVSYHPNPHALNYPTFTTECGTQTPKKTDGRTALLGNAFTPLHPSQMPSDPPDVQRNYVKRIVNRFNEEAVLQRHRPSETTFTSPPISPSSSPRQYSTLNHSMPKPPPPPPMPTYASSYSSEPLGPPPEGLFTMSRPKKSPVINGVKVMFDANNQKKDKDYSSIEKYKGGPYKTEISISDNSETDTKSPYRRQETFHYGDLDFSNRQLVKRNGDTGLSYNYDNDHNRYENYFEKVEDPGRRNDKYHFETWDTGDQLLFDTEDVNTAHAKTDDGEFRTTFGEKHQMWRNNKRLIIVEEPSPTIIRRKAKSQSDLTHAIEYPQDKSKLDKGISTDSLFDRKPDGKDTINRKQKDSWLRHFRANSKDKGIQCNAIPTKEPEELYGFGRYKILKPRNNTPSSFSNIPKLDKTTKKNDYNGDFSTQNGSDSVIYSQVDKSKKKKNTLKKKNIFSEEGKIGSLFKTKSEPLYIGPPPKTPQPVEDDRESKFFDDHVERTVKTSKRGFGFRLNAGKENERRPRSPYYDHDWYNVDSDVAAVDRQKRYGTYQRNTPELRRDIVEEEVSDISSLSNGEQKRHASAAGAIVHEIDYKKKEISYENVHRSKEDRNIFPNTIKSVWYRDADEDYRKEMAQNEVSYPAGSSVGSDRFYTVDRKEKSKKKLPPPSPRAYTLDRKHLQNKEKDKPVPNKSGVKILVNGKEIKDKSLKKSKKRDEPSSVQSDPMFVRGGLAAAYQARQRGNVRRSNSSAAGLSSRYHGGSTPNIRRVVASSEASSGSESSRQYRPLVMYIPGVNHTDKSSQIDERRGVSVSRSHSMVSPTRPPRTSKKSNQKYAKGSRTDLYRDIYEEDEIMPLASQSSKKKPPKVPVDSRKNSDIKRRHSMPKDTKFSWLKWKIRGKPSREP